MEKIKNDSIKLKLTKTIKHNYQFTENDECSIKKLLKLMKENSDDFVKNFYEFIFNFEHAKAFLKNEEIINYHTIKIKEWFLKLFSGNYNLLYFNNLEQISDVHSSISLPTHYINASFNFVRRYLLKLLINNNHLEYLDIIEKIVDINLDVLTSSYFIKDIEKTVSAIKNIKEALDSSTFVPFYQPLIRNSDKKIIKYECLVRIEKEDGTIIAPFDFLSYAKEVKLYSAITKIIIQKTFKNFENFKEEFSVNLSIDDIEDEDTAKLIIELLEKNPEIGNKLTFEILESEEIKNYKLVKNFINKVIKYNVKIAIDDFGSGFSNIEHLTNIPIDFIKIDGSLIKDLTTNSKNLAAIESIVEFAKRINVKTVAEFVSSKEIYKIVKKLGIDYSQGYYFGKPEPIDYYIKRQTNKFKCNT